MARVAQTIKESWDTIEEYRHLMNVQQPEPRVQKLAPMKTRPSVKAVPVQAAAAAAEKPKPVAIKRAVSYNRRCTLIPGQGVGKKTFLPSIKKVNV